MHRIGPYDRPAREVTTGGDPRARSAGENTKVLGGSFLLALTLPKRELRVSRVTPTRPHGPRGGARRWTQRCAACPRPTCLLGWRAPAFANLRRIGCAGFCFGFCF
jgi:hypothetical protein